MVDLGQRKVDSRSPFFIKLLLLFISFEYISFYYPNSYANSKSYSYGIKYEANKPSKSSTKYNSLILG